MSDAPHDPRFDPPSQIPVALTPVRPALYTITHLVLVGGIFAVIGIAGGVGLGLNINPIDAREKGQEEGYVVGFAAGEAVGDRAGFERGERVGQTRAEGAFRETLAKVEREFAEEVDGMAMEHAGALHRQKQQLTAAHQRTIHDLTTTGQKAAIAAREEGVEAGLAKGGYTDGFDAGYASGRKAGETVGVSIGQDHASADAQQFGYEQGYTQGTMDAREESREQVQEVEQRAADLETKLAEAEDLRRSKLRQARDEGYRKGVKEGKEEGYKDGYRQGVAVGTERAKKKGW